METKQGVLTNSYLNMINRPKLQKHIPHLLLAFFLGKSFAKYLRNKVNFLIVS